MSKMILLLSLLGTAIIFAFGMTDPSNPVVWLASTSMNFAYLRVAMMVALAALLVTHPPRNVYLRFIIGIFAASLATWSLWATYQNHMKFIDSLALLQFSVATGLTVLENRYFPAESEDERLESARNTRRLAVS